MSAHLRLIRVSLVLIFFKKRTERVVGTFERAGPRSPVRLRRHVTSGPEARCGMCYSTTRTVIGSQFVQEKLSIALLFCCEQLLLKPRLVDNMLTGLFSPTIRNVIGSQMVRKKLSIRASFLTSGFFFSKPLSGGHYVGRGVFLNDQKCYGQ